MVKSQRRFSSIPPTIEVVEKSTLDDLRAAGRFLLFEEFPYIYRTALDGAHDELRFNDSKTPVLWRCDAGHSWSESTHGRLRRRNCPVCSFQVLVPGINDLQTLYPDLTKEFDVEKNEMSADALVGNGSRYLWWICPKGHSYSTKLARRIEGLGCAYCGNFKLMKGYNDFESHYPERAKEFNRELNGGIGADEIFKSSNVVFWWTCKRGHDYKSAPNCINLDPTKDACPYCSKRFILEGFNDVATRLPIRLMREFDFEKNEDPKQIILRSYTILWWKCDRGHSWRSSVRVRLSASASGCSRCNAHPVRGVNDLETLYPQIASMYVEGQEIPLSELRWTSARDIEWCCREGHRFTTSPSELVKHNGICRKCTGPSFRSGLEQSVFDFLADLPELEHRHMVVNSFRLISPLQLDIFIPHLNAAIEVNGDYYHDRELYEQDIHNGTDISKEAKKTASCEALGIHLFHLWERDWKSKRDTVERDLKRFLIESSWRYLSDRIYETKLFRDGSSDQKPTVKDSALATKIQQQESEIEETHD